MPITRLIRLFNHILQPIGMIFNKFNAYYFFCLRVDVSHTVKVVSKTSRPEQFVIFGSGIHVHILHLPMVHRGERPYFAAICCTRVQ